MPQNNCGSGYEHAQLKTVQRLNSGNLRNIQASYIFYYVGLLHGIDVFSNSTENGLSTYTIKLIS